jgi:hypothetical protein
MTTSHSSDIEDVEAASLSFYTALSVLDDGTRMEAVWANTPYVTYVGPNSRSIIVGWDAQKQYWKSFNTSWRAASRLPTCMFMWSAISLCKSALRSGMRC